MSRELRRVLIELRDKRLLEAFLRGKNDISEELVFPSPEGSILDPDNLYHRYFQPVLSKAGLRKIRLHDLRQHADFLIMPTTNWEQQLGGARALSRVGIIKGFPGKLTAYRQVGIVLV